MAQNLNVYSNNNSWGKDFDRLTGGESVDSVGMAEHAVLVESAGEVATGWRGGLGRGGHAVNLAVGAAADDGGALAWERKFEFIVQRFSGAKRCWEWCLPLHTVI